MKPMKGRGEVRGNPERGNSPRCGSGIAEGKSPDQKTSPSVKENALRLCIKLPRGFPERGHLILQKRGLC